MSAPSRWWKVEDSAEWVGIVIAGVFCGVWAGLMAVGIRACVRVVLP